MPVNWLQTWRVYWLDVKMSLCPAGNSSLASHTTRESCDRQVFRKPPSGRESCEKVSYPAGQKLPAGLHHTPFIFPEGLSSIETLLTNIQVRLCRGFIIIIIIIILRWIGRGMSRSLGFPEMVTSRRGRHLSVIGMGMYWPASQILHVFVIAESQWKCSLAAFSQQKNNTFCPYVTPVWW